MNRAQQQASAPFDLSDGQRVVGWKPNGFGAATTLRMADFFNGADGGCFEMWLWARPEMTANRAHFMWGGCIVVYPYFGEIRFYGLQGSTVTQWSTYPTLHPSSTWFHVAVIRNPSIYPYIHICLNGIERGTVIAGTANTNTWDETVDVRFLNNNPIRSWLGSIGWARASRGTRYKVTGTVGRTAFVPPALSPAPRVDSATVCLYRFDRGASTLVDETGRFHGQFTNYALSRPNSSVGSSLQWWLPPALDSVRVGSPIAGAAGTRLAAPAIAGHYGSPTRPNAPIGGHSGPLENAS